VFILPLKGSGELIFGDGPQDPYPCSLGAVLGQQEVSQLGCLFWKEKKKCPVRYQVNSMGGGIVLIHYQGLLDRGGGVDLESCPNQQKTSLGTTIQAF
jgi:hypothetical protein